MKKIRIPISEETATEILFLSDRTCCVCNDRSKGIQIHHIDEDPSNNEIDNLCILCLDCHNQVSLKGGFGRKLDAAQVKKYRLDWLSRIKEKRKKIDDFMSIKSDDKSQNCEEEYVWYKSKEDSIHLEKYIQKLPGLKKAQHSLIEVECDHGYTMDIVFAYYNLITFYEAILAELATFYPEGSFHEQDPKKYFSRLSADRFTFCYSLRKVDPDWFIGGYDKIEIAEYVAQYLDKMIPELVGSLTHYYFDQNEIDFEKWYKLWCDSCPQEFNNKLSEGFNDPY